MVDFNRTSKYTNKKQCRERSYQEDRKVGVVCDVDFDMEHVPSISHL